VCASLDSEPGGKSADDERDCSLDHEARADPAADGGAAPVDELSERAR
jgi:hypothetical protein